MKLPEMLEIAREYFDVELPVTGGDINLSAWMRALSEEALEKFVKKKVRVDIFVHNFLQEFDTGIQIETGEEGRVKAKYSRTYYEVVLDHIKTLSELHIDYTDITFKDAARICQSERLKNLITTLWNIRNQLKDDDYKNIEFDMAFTDLSDINEVNKLVRNYNSYLRTNNEQR